MLHQRQAQLGSNPYGNVSHGMGGQRPSAAMSNAVRITQNQTAANLAQHKANTAAGVDMYGNSLQQKQTAAGQPAPGPQSPEQKLDQTRQDIYGAWDKQLGLFQSQPYAQLTGQMQQRASGANAPYSQQTITSDIGAQTDAINRQLQQQNLAANRSFDRSAIGGGLRTSGEASRTSAAGANTRRASMDIQSRADRANFAEQAQGQRDLSDWLRQEMNLRYGATAGLAGAKGREVAFEQTPGGGVGGPGGRSGGPGAGPGKGGKGGAKPKDPGPQPMPGDRGAPTGLPGLGGAGLPWGKWEPRPGEWEPQPWDNPPEYGPGDFSLPGGPDPAYDPSGPYPEGLPGLGGPGDWGPEPSSPGPGPWTPMPNPPWNPLTDPGPLPDPYGPSPQPTNLPPGGDFGGLPQWPEAPGLPARASRPPESPGGAWPGPYGPGGASGPGAEVPAGYWTDHATFGDYYVWNS